MAHALADTLRAHGIRPSAHRLLIAEHVLTTDQHPSADAVLQFVSRKAPMISRATVYNTLALFVDKGLLRRFALTEGHVVFDPKMERHHHLVDDDGHVHDVPWSSLKVSGVRGLEGYDVDDFQVVLHGRKKG